MIPAAIIRFFLGRWITTAEGEIKAGAGWVFATPVHMLIVALALSIAGNAWQHHGRAAIKADLAQEHAARDHDNATWVTIDRINHASLDKLVAALNRQSAAVRAWAVTANARQQAAQAALRDAQAKGAALDKARAAITAEAATGCRTGDAVMAAKGEL